ncbi:MAG TPA: PEP-CTERM sorting domain-containing protein [Casimicrobiaceae bacterium]|nr:PEP-CTERM sorting domain-containing protein [Casimicrobiaceae bacterium]
MLDDESLYVEFAANPGVLITSLEFNNIPVINTFETANFSVTSEPRPPGAVPEPATYALLSAGLVAVGDVGRRNRESGTKSAIGGAAVGAVQLKLSALASNARNRSPMRS